MCVGVWVCGCVGVWYVCVVARGIYIKNLILSLLSALFGRTQSVRMRC